MSDATYPATVPRQTDQRVDATQDQPSETDFDDTPLRQMLRALPAREEKILLLYYRDNLTMQQISDRIGVNESRVSQLHARGIRRLRTAMGVTHG